MKLQLMFLLMDVLMLLACGYFWLKTCLCSRDTVALEITKS